MRSTRLRTALLATTCALGIVATATPAHADANCGGTAPLRGTCSTFGWIPGPFSWGCDSTNAYTGEISVTITTATAAATFTCYFAGGTFVDRTSTLKAGTFYVGQSYSLDGAATGVGGWMVFVTP